MRLQINCLNWSEKYMDTYFVLNGFHNLLLYTVVSIVNLIYSGNRWILFVTRKVNVYFLITDVIFEFLLEKDWQWSRISLNLQIFKRKDLSSNKIYIVCKNINLVIQKPWKCWNVPVSDRDNWFFLIPTAAAHYSF